MNFNEEENKSSKSSNRSSKSKSAQSASIFDEKLFAHNKNKIHVKFGHLRDLVEDVFQRDDAQDYSALIAKFSAMSDYVLGIHAKMSYSVSMKDVRLEDAKYIKFLYDLNEALDEKYRENTMKLHFFHCNEITRTLFALVKVFLSESTQAKVKFHY